MLITNKSLLKNYYSDKRVWQGIPGIAVTKKGRTFISFYSGGTKETYGNYAVLIKSDNGIDFGEPIAVVKKEGSFRCFDPVLWIDPLDRLWFIWNVMPGEEVMASICEAPDADTLVWSKEFYIGRGIMMNKPTVLSSGEWLFPIAIWKFDIYTNFRKKAITVDDIAGAYVYKTADNGKSFIRLGAADVYNRSFDEHMVYEKENGVLRMLVRLKNGIGESYSYDRGKKWSSGHTTELGGPSSRFFISRLRSGRILLINHYNFTKRNNLSAFLSEDDGVTFPYRLMLDERSSVSYPDAIETDDGYINITYDRERGCFKPSLEEAYSSAREILTARITEDDIISGKLTSKESYLKRVVCKLGHLAEGIIDPYYDSEIKSSEISAELIADSENDPIDAVFERYPTNCANACNYDSKKLDTLISRFRETENKDEKILKDIIDLVRSIPQNKTNEPIVESVMEFVKIHLCDDILVSEIAERFNVSVYYLSHVFKSSTGTTLTEYRNELRLTKAKKLLIDTDMSIMRIASSVGFDSVSYFTESFSRSELISPTKYRQLHKIIRG